MWFSKKFLIFSTMPYKAWHWLSALTQIQLYFNHLVAKLNVKPQNKNPEPDKTQRDLTMKRQPSNMQNLASNLPPSAFTLSERMLRPSKESFRSA